MRFRPRIIPCLLLKGKGLVKTRRFKNPVYLGDPINIVRIFNDKEVDEIILLDITATLENRRPNFDYLGQIVSECFMPVCYGGAVRSLEDMKTLFSLGIEKIAVNTCAQENPALLQQAADRFGCQAVVASLDVRKNWLGKMEIHTRAGSQNLHLNPVETAKKMEAAGAGEILINSIDRDGTRQGYDLDLIRSVTQAVSIPVIACGGADTTADLAAAIQQGGASAASAGSLFVFQGKLNAVLISYPSPSELSDLFRRNTLSGEIQ